jgi:UPF0716 protein FxsA
MFLLIAACVVLLPLVELWFIVQVGQEFGVLPTVALLLIISLIGTSLVKREGVKVYGQFMTAVRSGQEPTREIVHGVCILTSGVLLLAPGFFSDVIGIVLLLPPFRAVVARIAVKRARRVTSVINIRHSGNRVEYEGYLPSAGDVIDVDPYDGEAGA